MKSYKKLEKRFGLSRTELSLLLPLTTPIKIQNWLDRVPLNWEKRGETYMSPRRVLREHKMHCFEGALLAGAILWLHDKPPLLLDLKTDNDVDHVVALYKRHGYFGAISKTNHTSLRFRDPIYKNLRELALSYFHEYFNDNSGKKVLHSYSAQPFDLSALGSDWITAKEDLFYIAQAIDHAPHRLIVPQRNCRLIRPADHMERRAGKLIEWPRSHHRT